ncbi:xylose-binding protein [Saccharicrinis carchari]|uniref:Xylose-binding protein n=1 Tax=Saccharicrinis carchari TaxID=1168039 RepID=A0A521E3D1_SACCC|nr:substrate-binding domain-containing protein [Saccharicrinis carchari]SMO78464.1 xylose-binding protein [Saccharicrinis carchari]
MNRNIYLIISLAFLLFTACKQKEQITIGFLYPSEVTERYNKESSYFKNYCATQGVEVIIKTASNDESIQLELANEMIEQGVDALVLIAANINTAGAIVRNAHAEGIPVMAYNRMIKNSEVDFFVASNNDLIGKAMVDGILKEKPSGNFVILGGDKFDKNGEDQYAAVKKYLKPKVESKQVNIVYETYIEKWDRDIASFEMEKVLQLYGDDIDAVIAGFDGMATGVIDVLESYGLAGSVAVSGQDAELTGCRNVIAGKQTVTVFHPLKTIAEKGAQVAIEMAKGKGLDAFVNSTEYNGLIDVPTHRVSSIAVNKNNIEEVLVGSGFYTKKELYGE